MFLGFRFRAGRRVLFSCSVRCERERRRGTKGRCHFFLSFFLSFFSRARDSCSIGPFFAFCTLHTAHCTLHTSGAIQHPLSLSLFLSLVSRPMGRRANPLNASPLSKGHFGPSPARSSTLSPWPGLGLGFIFFSFFFFSGLHSFSEKVDVRARIENLSRGWRKEEAATATATAAAAVERHPPPLPPLLPPPLMFSLPHSPVSVE